MKYVHRRGKRNRRVSGDGGPASHAQLEQPLGIAVDSHDIYVGDFNNKYLRKINAGDLTISSIAGTGLEQHGRWRSGSQGYLKSGCGRGGPVGQYVRRLFSTSVRRID